MTPKPVLLWKLNALNVVLHDEFVRERILIRRTDGEYKAANWLGFIDRAVARYLWKGRPVKLKAERFGYEGDFNTD